MSNLANIIHNMPSALRSSAAIVSVFTLSIFLSAMLLFSVQPMFAKMALPLLGGSSNVWNTAMVFFQGTLLGGYLYAHLISNRFRLRTQIVIHGCVLAAGFIFLPLALASGWEPPTGGFQAFWLIGLFAVSIGIPFFAISANAPLMQRWFSYTDHKDANDPYFLYAASNLGSLISLGLYPIYFEPMMRLNEQTSLWATGYRLLLVCIVISGLFAFIRRRNVSSESVGITAKTKQSLHLSDRVWWIFLAFLPSSLMLGVTSHMTNNIAAAPFLWIIPLALYLLTFIIVFAKNPWVNSQNLKWPFIAALTLAIASGVFLKLSILTDLSISLGTYFVIALMCHMRLAEARPDVSRLTEFYIWMSLGGVLGGVFNALIAPVLFNGTYEYLMILGLSVLVHPRFTLRSGEGFRRVIIAALLTILGFVIFKLISGLGMAMSINIFIGGSIAMLGFGYVRQVGSKIIIDLAILASVAFVLPSLIPDYVFKDRSFFGVIKVQSLPGELGVVHRLAHGDTIHNYQIRSADYETTPLAYYTPGNTFDIALSAVRRDKKDIKLAMIGLGAGAMACYEHPGDEWTYFEIDPVVVRAATTPEIFSYMSQCSQKSDIRLGDARLKILELAKNSQDIIMVDAFSSDSIPSHLLTREALAIYMSRLKDDGVLFFHTSNRVSDVDSVIVRLAEDADLAVRHIIKLKKDFKDQPYAEFVTPSTALMVGKADNINRIIADDPQWTRFRASPNVKLWSDDYTNIVSTLISHRRSEAGPVPNLPTDTALTVSTE